MTFQEESRPTIRRATPADLSAIVGVRGDPDESSERLQALHETHLDRTVVVRSGEVAVAYAIWEGRSIDNFGGDKKAHFLIDVRVHPEHRRKGFGTLAVEAVGWVMLADTKGVQPRDGVLMATCDEQATDVQAFLRHVGFNRTGKDDYPGQDTIRLTYGRDLIVEPPPHESVPDGMIVPTHDSAEVVYGSMTSASLPPLPPSN